MFTNSNSWNLKKVFDMPTHCEECGQKFELEVGFWYGTGYVSYALSVAFSVASFVAWYVLIGLLVVLQPWLMRLSRVIYLYFFVKYDPNYKTNAPAKNSLT
jgi:hypothetical protein